MLTKLRKTKAERSSQGFTIIEVMIVLAIAGLILLIVFLAVPALQRNARNTSIKTDAGNVASGLSTWESNNDGALPTAVAGTGTVNVTGGAGTTADTITVNGATVVNVVTSQPAALGGASGTVSVYLKHTCLNSASPRAIAVYYYTETSTNTQRQCVDT